MIRTPIKLAASICTLLFLLATLANCGGLENDSAQTPTSSDQEVSFQYRTSFERFGQQGDVYNLLVAFNGSDIPEGARIRVHMTDPITGETLLDSTKDIDEYRDEGGGPAVKMVFWRVEGTSIFNTYGWTSQMIMNMDIEWITVEYLSPN